MHWATSENLDSDIQFKDYHSDYDLFKVLNLKQMTQGGMMLNLSFLLHI